MDDDGGDAISRGLLLALFGLAHSMVLSTLVSNRDVVPATRYWMEALTCFQDNLISATDTHQMLRVKYKTFAPDKVEEQPAMDRYWF